jgi:hypothetical protein
MFSRCDRADCGQGYIQGYIQGYNFCALGGDIPSGVTQSPKPILLEKEMMMMMMMQFQ